MVYSDGLELVNPLASGKGKHKICQVFWQICDVPRYQRSSVDRLQLGMVFKEKLLKKHGYSKVYKHLVDDLILLERDGIEVSKPFTRNIKAGVLLFSGDNLESHLVGGFSASFSSKDICRHCHLQYKELQDNVHNFGEKEHKPWTEAEYDSIEVEGEDPVDEYQAVDDLAIGVTGENLFNEFEEPEDELPEIENVEENTDSEDGEEVEDEAANHSNCGVKRKCVFNRLSSFHCVSSMPPDSLHDLMEGVIPQDLLGIIRIMIAKGWFLVENYNKALHKVQLSSQESSNKPQMVPISQNVKKLSGKAVSNWVHIRIFLFILYMNGWIRDFDDPVLLLAIKLNEMTERITAETFRAYELETLETLIIEYFDLRKVVLDEYPVLGRLKPKHHYITHYPSYIEKFGPPSGYWTGRFESKHRIAKSTAQASKNFVNISYTVSHRQQSRACSTYYSGMFSLNKYKLPMKVKSREDLNDSELEKKLKEMMGSVSDLVCSEILFKCRKYKSGDVVILKRSDLDEIEVGLVKSIVVKNKQVFLLVRRGKVVQKYLRFLQSTSMSSDLDMVNIESLQDSYPLFKRGTEEKFLVLPHHFISFSYD